jgi:hypothetical protein
MHLDPLPEGGFLVQAEDLGPLLGVEPRLVPGLMRAGQITRRSETGEGEDFGRFRLTFRYGAVTVRLVITTDGEVVQQSRIRRTEPR